MVVELYELSGKSPKFILLYNPWKIKVCFNLNDNLFHGLLGNPWRSFRVIAQIEG